MKLKLKISVLILAAACISSGAVVFGGESIGCGEEKKVQNEANLEAALSAADVSRDEADVKKADSHKVVFFANGQKYVYLFDGESSVIREYYISDECDNFDSDKDKKAEKAREKAEKETEKAREEADKAQKKAYKLNKKQ